MEAARRAWAERVLAGLPPAVGEWEALAIDGKTLRGSRKQGGPAVHLRAGLSQRRGLTLWPQAVADKTKAIPVLEDVWRGLGVEGRVMTMDTWRTQRAIAERMVQGGGDEVMLVKGNHPPLPHDSQRVFHEAPRSAATRAPGETVDRGHGRREQRRRTASSALVDYRDGPGLAPVFQRERRVLVQKSGEQRHEVVYGVTRLSREQVDPEQLRGFVRQHWQIANKLHGVRDVTCDEERSPGRCGSLPQVMAAVRTTAISLMHWAGETHIAAACRRFAAQPWSA